MARSGEIARKSAALRFGELATMADMTRISADYRSRHTCCLIERVGTE